MTTEYNYVHFPLDMDASLFAAFPAFLRAGQPAPDGELMRLDDAARVRLSDYWRASPVVIEFGSVT